MRGRVSPMLVVPLMALACSGGESESSLPDGGRDGSTLSDAPPSDARTDATPPPPTLPAATLTRAKSGSRLKVERWETADGVRARSSASQLWDSMLNLSCTWTRMSGGQWRCFPSGTFVPLSSLYSDIGCTQRVAVFGGSVCEIPEYFGLPIFTTCPVSFQTFQRGPMITAATLYVRTPAGECVARNTMVGPEDRVFAWGPEVPDTSFVAATVRMPQGPEMPGPIFLDAEDGASISYRWHDPMNKTECTFNESADGSLRCLPVVTGAINAHFSDPTCVTPVAEGVKSSCAAENVFLSQTTSTGCESRRRIYRAGMKVPAAYLKATNACTPSPLPEIADFFTLGAELPPATFVSGMSGILPGETRLRSRGLTTLGATVEQTGFWDSQLSLLCAPTTAADGVTRCLPNVVSSIANAYRDAECTKPLVVRAPTSCRSLYAGRVDATTCPARLRIFAVESSPYTMPLYTSGQGTCRPATLEPGLTVHAVGEEVPPATFVELTRATE